MTPIFWYVTAFVLYTALLFLIAWLTSRQSGSNSFFSGNKKAPWPIVAYGMIGASISGVTFISVPGNVMRENFYYMPLVLGFVIGYIVIAKVLLPLYYKMNLTSIYGYIEQRFGFHTYRTSAAVFMVSRILGAAVRVFVVVVVLHALMGGAVPFWGVAAIFIVLLFLYTFRGGVRTIIWTDVLQTTFMLLAVILTVISICKSMNWSFADMSREVANTPYSTWFNWNWGAANNAVKQFISGIFVTVAMTGVDQSMMQKNLACKNLRAAQKNMYTTSIIIVVANLLFLLLGAVLAMYAAREGISVVKTDQLFPTIVTQRLSLAIGIFFIIGLISASYPSAGGALTALTTSFCVDFLGFNDKRKHEAEAGKTRVRRWVHAGFAALFFVIMLILYAVSNDAVVNLVYKLASYTYGPLLGFFFFGILTRRIVKDKAMPFVAVAAPVLCYLIDLGCKTWFHFGLGFTLLILNACLTFLMMWALSYKEK